MLRLSRQDIEGLSRQALLGYLKRTPEHMDSVDPVDFAEKMCDLHFEFADMSAVSNMIGITSYGTINVNLHSATAQVQVFKMDGKTAYIDQKLLEDGHQGRLNFTMMHEAAHQLLAIMFPSEYNFKKQPFICRMANERCSYPITNWAEWQTNALASCLLLPRELVQRQMEQQGLGSKIRLLNKVFAPKEYGRFSSMADSLGVSKTALSIRLGQLGMIERNDFRDPYALVNVYADDWDVV